MAELAGMVDRRSPPEPPTLRASVAWTFAGALAGALALVAAHDVPPLGPDALFVPLAIGIPFAIAAATVLPSPAPAATGAGLVAGWVTVAALVVAGWLWAPPAACRDPRAFCEGVGLDRLVVMAAVPGLVAGIAMGLLAWRPLRRALRRRV